MRVKPGAQVWSLEVGRGTLVGKGQFRFFFFCFIIIIISEKEIWCMCRGEEGVARVRVCVRGCLVDGWMDRSV